MDNSTHQPIPETDAGMQPEADEPRSPEPSESDRHAAAAVQSLRQAMRRARHDDAERNGALLDQRVMRIGRLELLLEALAPLQSQIPRDVDLFDIGLMPGANPRLFIDMIGFVEMGRDARHYRFVQDTRYGRIQIAESAEIETMVDAVTDYVARRLLERDKALASDTTMTPAPPATKASPKIERPRKAEPVATRPRRTPIGWFAAAFAFLIDLLGSIAFFTVMAAIGWLVWNHWYGQS